MIFPCNCRNTTLHSFVLHLKRGWFIYARTLNIQAIGYFALSFWWSSVPCGTYLFYLLLLTFLSNYVIQCGKTCHVYSIILICISKKRDLYRFYRYKVINEWIEYHPTNKIFIVYTNQGEWNINYIDLFYVVCIHMNMTWTNHYHSWTVQKEHNFVLILSTNCSYCFSNYN